MILIKNYNYLISTILCFFLIEPYNHYQSLQTRSILLLRLKPQLNGGYKVFTAFLR